MRYLTLIFLILTAGKSLSQQKNELGVVLPDEFSQKVYLSDSSAEAVILSEKSVVNFLYEDDRSLGYYMENKVHVRKKILKTAGVQSHGVLIIPFIQAEVGYEESIRDLKAFVYNLEGTRIVKEEVGSKAIFTEKVQDRFYQKKILFPNVREGSIIEYEYLHITPMSVRDKPRTWYFQGEIPKLWSEFIVTVPPQFYYQIILSGFLNLHVNKNEQVDTHMGHSWLDRAGKSIRYDLAVKDAPALKNEPYVTTAEDYMMKVDFELSQMALPNQPKRTFSLSWEDLDRTLLNHESWGNRLKKDDFLKNIAAPFKDISDPHEKLNKAYRFMTSEMKWNGYTGLWVRENLRKVYDNRTGSASELNMLMIAFLRELGFQAHPVILSTRHHGRISPDFPLLDRFNYTLAMIEQDGEQILVDITDPMSKPGSIPFECLNYHARVVRPKKSEMIVVRDKDKLKDMESYKFTINPEDGTLSGNYTLYSSGYSALNRRTEFTRGQEAFRKKLLGRLKKVKTEHLEFRNFDDPDKNTEISFQFEVAGDGEGSQPGMIYLDPLLFGKTEKNPFTRKTREFPVDFGYLTEHVITASFVIPEGYAAEELPKNTAVALPDGGGRFTYICALKDNEIQVVSRILLNKGLYAAEEYEGLRDFYGRIVNKQAEQIILKKK